MRQIRMLAAGVVVWLTLLIPLQASAAGWLVGAAADGTIYDVDMVTGAAGNPRSTGIENLDGITFTGDDTLYGLSSNGSLYTIDLAAGAATDTGMVVGSGRRYDLTWDPTNDALFLVYTAPGASGAKLMMFDPRTEDEVLIGWFTSAVSAIAVDPAGTLLAIDDNQGLLVAVDTTPRPPEDRFLDIVAEIPLGLDLNWAGGLVAATEDVVYWSGSEMYGADTGYELNRSTGLLAVLGPTGVPDGLTSLAFVPEPASLLLLGIGAACMAKERQRKSETTCFDLEETL
ncbi:MAG: PEP-CTERM sorting domain-containing protein [Planctomycetes bacterium]|nr:PEP-CTERM sorting domain-containing protein [Planctomycetota bacterium]